MCAGGNSVCYLRPTQLAIAELPGCPTYAGVTAHANLSRDLQSQETEAASPPRLGNPGPSHQTGRVSLLGSECLSAYDVRSTRTGVAHFPFELR